MIIGRINAVLDAVIPLQLTNGQGKDILLEAVIDTGFNSSLALPYTVIEHLALEPYDTALTMLADGSQLTVNLYLVRVLWQGETRIVSAENVEGQALIGMQMLHDHLVTLPVRYGETVTISSLPPRQQR